MGMTFREQMKGFPVWQMTVIGLIRFSEPIAFTSMFPYVYFMVRDFGVAKEKADIATYSGYLSGSFAFFQFLCSVQWGYASDRYGRKPILLIGLMGTALSMLLFGFSRSFGEALFARSLMGMLNGNVAVLRTTVGEVATEKRHQATAFSIIPLLWNFGSILGPMLGGSKYLTRPKGLEVDFKGPDWYENFITKYPYALSNIFVASLIMFSWLVAFLFLEETLPKARNRRDIGLEIGNWILAKLGYHASKSKDEEAETEVLIPDGASTTDQLSFNSEYSLILNPRANYASIVGDDEALIDDDDASIESMGPFSRRMSEALLRRYSSENLTMSRMTTREGRRTLWHEFKEAFTPAVSQTLTANFLLSFHTIVFSEFLPVFLAGTAMPEKLKFPWKIVGGFGYDSSSIGTLLSTTGLIGSLNIMIMFPWLDRKFSTTTNFAAASLVFPIIYVTLPFLVFTLPGYSTLFPEGFTQVAIYVLCFVNAIAVSLGFPNMLMLVHRSSPPRNRAFINGLALSFSSLARCVGPLVWGHIMAFSDRIELGGLSWYILAALSIAVAIQAFCMTDYEDTT